jgi:hypothetical protein
MASAGRVVVKEVDRGWAALRDAVRAYKAKDPHVKVGFLDDGGKGSADHGGLTTAELAAVMEFGTEDGRIPARSFVGSTFEANKARYVDDLGVLLVKVLEGTFTLQKVLAIMGLRMASDINKAVRSGDGVPPPNAPSTIKAKGSARTLLDTARMIAALTYAVVVSGGEVEKGGPDAG